MGPTDYGAFSDPDTAHVRQCNHEENMNRDTAESLRAVALSHAVEVMGGCGDPMLVLSAAKTFLAFLCGEASYGDLGDAGGMQ